MAAVFAVGGYGSSAPVSGNRILGAVDSTQVARVRGTAHPLARAQNDQGRTDPSGTISGAITFRLSAAQQAELDQLLHDQQDPKSPNYHRWITPDQYAARFGMSSNDLQKVSSWLQSQGLNVDSISRNRNEISFSGSVGQVEYAFKTEIHNYTIRGERHFANAMDVSLPAAFSAQVLGVRGLDSFAPKPYIQPAPRVTSNLSGNHFLAPGDFWTIYNVPHTTYTGVGQSIAIIGQTTISTTDLDTFRTNSGLPLTSASNFQQVQVGGTATLCSGDQGEADLDLEWSNAVAPQAKIIYVFAGVNSGGSCTNRSNNVFNALQDAITNNRAPIISISYGNCESNLGSFVHTLQQWAQQANSQGQTISGPAGDQGAADCESATATSATHGLAVDVPAAIPEVTGVGGSEFNGDSTQCANNSCPAGGSPADSPYWSGSSSLTSGASALTYIPEMTWNDTTAGGPLSSTGGGASTVFGKPSWQTGTGVPADGKRDVPDIAINASPAHDPYLTCGPGDCTNGFRDASNNFAAVGGTSAGAPTFAGILALIGQATSSNGLGNVNPMLYSLAANNSSNNAFHDTPSGNNKVPCTSGSTNCPSGTTSIGFTAGAGYDLTTGLGSLNVANLISAWMGVTPSADFSISGANSTVAAAGGTGTSTITVTAMSGFTGTVNLTCTPSSTSAQITCSLNPTSLDMSTGTTNGTKTATLSMVTVADLQMPNHWQRRGTWFAATGGLFAAVLLGGISTRRRWWGVLGLFLTVAILTGVACGGGSSTTQKKTQGTPAGSYTV
ncbi:MAG TPA: protease pro-enzyme activation domain-containing protein, partial [Terriglobales bacterium]|nr:protease pro-enzyme activation domain-containing protein [Terriglobales bacterium]